MDGSAWLNSIRTRDGFSLSSIAGVKEDRMPTHDHHLSLQIFIDPSAANDLLSITLCARCHRLAERNVLIKKEPGGALIVATHKLAPLLCDVCSQGLRVHYERVPRMAPAESQFIGHLRQHYRGIGLSKCSYECRINGILQPQPVQNGL